MLEDKDLRSLQEVRQKVDAAYEAYLEFRSFSQQQVDKIVAHVAAVARANSTDCVFFGSLTDFRRSRPLELLARLECDPHPTSNTRLISGCL